MPDEGQGPIGKTGFVAQPIERSLIASQKVAWKSYVLARTQGFD